MPTSLTLHFQAQDSGDGGNIYSYVEALKEIAEVQMVLADQGQEQRFAEDLLYNTRLIKHITICDQCGKNCEDVQ